MGTWSVLKCTIAQCFGWTSDRRMDQQHEATCQAHNHKWTGCGSASGLQIEIKASWFILFSHTGSM